MKAIEHYDLKGNKIKTWQPRIDNALPIIEKRMQHAMPVETVDADKIRDLVSSIDIDVQRDISRAEAYQMLKMIKDFILQEIDKADKYYVKRGGGKNETG